MSHATISKGGQEGISRVFLPTNRFKSALITLTFALPLSRERAAENALIPYLLHRSCSSYPTLSQLQGRLAELYGAAVFADVDKLGDVQVMRLGITFLEDRFALEGEKIAQECAGLLCDMIFRPALEGDAFREEDVRREKRLLLETLDGEYNDKRTYARKRLEEIMCAGEPFGVDRLGSRDSIRVVTPQSATAAWQNMLAHAKVQVNMVGNLEEDAVYSLLRGEFEKLPQRAPVSLSTEIIPTAETIKREKEELEVAQSKLVMGYRCSLPEMSDHRHVLAVAVDTFGGGPYSRLFMNVREKMGLCYYCSARFNPQKGIMMIQSGVEQKNLQLAEEEIGRQLEVMRKGEFTDEELSASKLAIADAVGSAGDSLYSLDGWYYRQMTAPDLLDPEEYMKRVRSVSREEVTKAAGSLTLDTVYSLEGTQVAAD